MQGLKRDRQGAFGTVLDSLEDMTDLHATNCPFAPSDSAVPKFFSDKAEFSDTQRHRIVEMFRRALGRDLTSEERKYLGMSGDAVPLDDLEPNTQKQTEEERRASPEISLGEASSK